MHTPRSFFLTAAQNWTAFENLLSNDGACAGQMQDSLMRFFGSRLESKEGKKEEKKKTKVRILFEMT